MKHRLTGNVPGIYTLWKNDEIVYIGRRWNCLLRVAEHTRKDSNKEFTHWSFEEVPLEQQHAREAHLIRNHQPRYNKTLG